MNYYIILEGVFLPNTWASGQHKYLKHVGHEHVPSKKNDAGASCPKFHWTTCQVWNITNFEMEIKLDSENPIWNSESIIPRPSTVNFLNHGRSWN